MAFLIPRERIYGATLPGIKCAREEMARAFLTVLRGRGVRNNLLVFW